MANDSFLRVLVANDSPTLRQQLTSQLVALGHQVREAADGKEAFREGLEVQPDLLLLEIMLPGMSGYEVAKRLRRTLGASCGWLVALDAHLGPGDVLASFEAGFDDFLPVPFNQTKLENVLASAQARKVATMV